MTTAVAALLSAGLLLSGCSSSPGPETEEPAQGQDTEAADETEESGEPMSAETTEAAPAAEQAEVKVGEKFKGP